MDKVLATLEEIGLLMESDLVLPSVTTLVAGEPVHGSWWKHPRSHEIYRVNAALGDHADVLATKLVSFKVTWVHRRLWPALVVVGTSRQPWQAWNLSVPARSLLSRVKQKKVVRASGRPALDLEKGLLVVATQYHTKSGAHRKMVESWKYWAERMGVATAGITVDEARTTLEAALARLSGDTGKGRLPWMDR